MKIGVDIDDVIADFMNPLLKFYAEITGNTVLFDSMTSYRFEEVWGGTREQTIAIIRKFYASNAFDLLKPIDGALEALRTLSQNHEIVFITSRHHEAKQKTPAWLAHHCPFISPQVIYAGEYDHGDNEPVTKATICIREEIGCIIEDNGSYAHQCAENGVRVYLLHRPWNTTVNHPALVRVSHWNEIVAHIARYPLRG